MHVAGVIVVAGVPQAPEVAFFQDVAAFPNLPVPRVPARGGEHRVAGIGDEIDQFRRKVGIVRRAGGGERRPGS